MSEDFCCNCNEMPSNCSCNEPLLYSTIHAVCPYCRHGNSPINNDCALYTETLSEYKCDNCGKAFAVNVHRQISFSWGTKKKEVK